ncbi:hypothetical protein ASF91_15000 [Rhizobium sp. Leaf155]|nr:hypothetical protein ASF91_15000 [Rhizobium sp. Leaf155]
MAVSPWRKLGAATVDPPPIGLVLPTPPFGATNGRLWLDTRQTSFMMTDNSGGVTTVGAIEDLFGKARGFSNGDKSGQPKLGPNGGILFDTDGQTLTSLIRDVVNGLSFISVYAAFRLDSASYAANSKRRAVLAVSEAAATATPPGNGSSQERLAAHLSGGGSGRKPFSSVSIMDGVVATTSTTSPAIPSLPSDAKVHAGWEYDLSQAIASQAIYENGALVGTATWTPTETDKKLNTADAVTVSLGQRAIPTGVNSGTLFGELFALIVLAEIPDATRRAQIHTYLNGAIA